MLNPSSLPSALVGIHTIIDCATARPEESTEKIDWEGKLALIQCAQVIKDRMYVNVKNKKKGNGHTEIYILFYCQL